MVYDGNVQEWLHVDATLRSLVQMHLISVVNNNEARKIADSKLPKEVCRCLKCWSAMSIDRATNLFANGSPRGRVDYW